MSRQVAGASLGCKAHARQWNCASARQRQASQRCVAVSALMRHLRGVAQLVPRTLGAAAGMPSSAVGTRRPIRANGSRAPGHRCVRAVCVGNGMTTVPVAAVAHNGVSSVATVSSMVRQDGRSVTRPRQMAAQHGLIALRCRPRSSPRTTGRRGARHLPSATLPGRAGGGRAWGGRVECHSQSTQRQHQQKAASGPSVCSRCNGAKMRLWWATRTCVSYADGRRLARVRRGS